MSKSKWIASLSNGETISEDHDLGIKGALSPWRNFMNYVKENKLEIRAVRLVVNGVHYHSPSFNCQGRFENDGHACAFWVARRAIMTIVGNVPVSTDVIELSYRINDVRHHLVVDENSNMCWIATSKTDKNGIDEFIQHNFPDHYPHAE